MTFNPHAEFSSPTEAINLIAAQPDLLEAMLSVVRSNVEIGKFGFASQVVNDFQTIRNVKSINNEIFPGLKKKLIDDIIQY